MARIAIVGVGAIGSVIAASLAVPGGGHELFLCVRRPLPQADRGVGGRLDARWKATAVLTDPEPGRSGGRLDRRRHQGLRRRGRRRAGSKSSAPRTPRW